MIIKFKLFENKELEFEIDDYVVALNNSSEWKIGEILKITNKYKGNPHPYYSINSRRPGWYSYHFRLATDEEIDIWHKQNKERIKRQELIRLIHADVDPYGEEDWTNERKKIKKPLIDLSSEHKSHRLNYAYFYPLYYSLKMPIHFMALFDRGLKSDLEEFKEVKKYFGTYVRRIVGFLNRKSVMNLLEELETEMKKENCNYDKCNSLIDSIGDKYYEIYKRNIKEDIDELIEKLGLSGDSRGSNFGNIGEFDKDLNDIKRLLKKQINKDIDPYGEEDWEE